MNKKKLFLSSLLPLAVTLTTASASATESPLLSYHSLSHEEMMAQAPTYTYVRCWYRTSHSTDEVATDWEWALDAQGEYLKVPGYWWSKVSFKNMFYTDMAQQEIVQACQNTLQVDHANADMMVYAADNSMSYNHTIWTNDQISPSTEINRIVAIGDSLSDTGNIFNAAQWRFPNPNSWFLGHFSNGKVWTEYLADDKQIPLYNWAVGGAAGENQYVALTGVTEQVESYLTYMELAKNYRPERTLFTLEFGLNDFMNYYREVVDVKQDYTSALDRLIESGAKHILLMTLPDATKAPQFKYSTQQDIDTVRAKIVEFNQFIVETATQLQQQQGLNVQLFDTYTLFESLTSHPQQHGFENAADACLNINRSSSADYLYSHDLTNDCAYHGSDKYVFWGVTHPTTAAHRYIAEKMLQTNMLNFKF